MEFSVGDIKCWLLSDGTDRYPPAAVFANVDPPELDVALAGRLDDEGLLRAWYHALLVASEGRLLLVDAGLGEFAETERAPAGHLVDVLRALGVDRADVDTVVITHAHPDHVGGLTHIEADRRLPVYRNATHVLTTAEWNAWTSDDSAAPQEFLDVARSSVLALGEQGFVKLYDADQELLAGVRMLPAHGHTPGHVVVEIASGDDVALYLGDAIVDELNVTHPEWLCAFDMHAAATVATRRALLEQARNGASVLASHLPRAAASLRRRTRFSGRPCRRCDRGPDAPDAAWRKCERSDRARG